MTPASWGLILAGGALAVVVLDVIEARSTGNHSRPGGDRRSGGRLGAFLRRSGGGA